MSWSKKVSLVLVTMFGLLITPPVAVAESAISQGFTSEAKLSPGTIVSMSNGVSYDIELATSDNVGRLLGAVSDTSLVELSKDDDAQVQVVTSGRTTVLVSTLNGTIKTGDYITASPLKGIGMKATESGRVIGVAQADFETLTDTSSRPVTDKTGVSRTVTVGMMPVQINVVDYESLDEKKTIVPQFIMNIAQAVSGKEVSVVRVLAALLVLVVGMSAVGVMLYASVRSSIASIGRNPLAAVAVNRGLVEISLLTLGILIVMLGAVYLILAL